MRAHFSSDVAFTPAVKAIQERKGSRRAYAAMERNRGWPTVITSELATFIAAQTSVFFASASREGQPYVQHRGGPPGFLHVLDERTLAFADFTGNRQYITIGNLSENSKAHLLLVDYTERRRVKIWGEAQVVDNDAELAATLMPLGYEARSEHVVLVTLTAWDSNCPRHIPERVEASEMRKVLEVLERRDERIAMLEAQVRRLGGKP